jgi:hypothetical protein
MSLRPSLLSAALIAAAALMAACSPGGQAEPPLFPLNKGWRWTYQVATETPFGQRRDTYVVENRGPTALPGGRTAQERRNSLGNRYFFTHDAAGIQRVAMQAEIEVEPRLDEEPQPRFVVRQPIVPGTSWQSETRLFLMVRRFDWPNEMKYGKPIAMDFEIEATDETVTVPAGTFEHCVIVAGHHQLKLYLDPVTGYGEVPINQREWYCPGAGMVRFIRSEPIKANYFNGGTVVYELTRLER